MGSPSAQVAAAAPRSLDFAILIEKYRAGPGFLGFDPRKSPELIARRLGVGAATVRRRLTEWRRSGFFLGYDVLPHPNLLGGGLEARLLEFPNSVAQETAVAPLSLLDGVIQVVPARDRSLVVYFVESDTQSQRRLLQLQQTPGVQSVGPPLVMVFAPCEHRMTRADWRLLKGLRREPEGSLAALARSVGLSVKTTSRRYEALLESGAIMFDPILDYSRFPQTLAIVVAFLDAPERAPDVGRQIRALSPQSAQSWGATPKGPEGPSESVHVMVCAPAAAELDDLVSKVAHLPGVEQSFLWYERSNIPVRGWLDERIDRILATHDTGA